jgi:iron complex outermembrane recepter protein
MKRFSSFLLASTSAATIATMSLVLPANAQEDGGTEAVTVSASRISIAGFEAPTPVTVVGLERIERDAKVDIGDVIRELPQAGSGASPNNGANSLNASQGNAGVDTISLRNLGANRNLVLFDGQRVVSSTIQDGAVDLSTIPTSLVERIDVVTGGASAAWGSDAVAGVVNLVLNKRFSGFKANFSASDGTNVEHRQAKVEATWGTDFDGDRGHLILSGNHTWSPDPVFIGQERWWRGTGVVPNPAYVAGNTSAPQLIFADHIGVNDRTQGGLINANTAGGAGSTLAANGLQGLMLTGPTDAVSTFNYGSTYNGSNCYNGCSNNERSAAGAYSQFQAVPYHSSTFFVYGSYQVTPSIKASVQLNYGLMAEQNTAALKTSNAVKIFADNAYLPTSIASRFGTLTYAGGTQLNGAQPNQNLTFGLDGANNRIATGPASTSNTDVYSMKNLCSAVGLPCVFNNRALMRGVFTLEGSLGSGWSWNTYLQSSSVRIRQRVYNNPITARFNNALDAVVVTPQNQGASGLALGSIQCRALLNPATATGVDVAGCQPMNLFGYQNVSGAAYSFVNPGTNPASGILDNETVYLNQTVMSASVQGILPFGLPAGPIAVAGGGEYRLEQARQANPDPARNGAWAAGNFASYAGEYNVEEGFLEATAPLLKDSYVQSLELNAAARYTHYSVSGDVTTWKTGLISQVNDDLRVRATWSYDIRAPLVNDLFSPGVINKQNNCAPLNGIGSAFPCDNISGGNTNLRPETAVTVSGGVVLTPHWFDGLSLSLDWYSISLHGLIVTTAFNTVVSRCFAGEQVYCSQIVGLNGNTYAQIKTSPVNASAQTTSGLDFEARYTTGLFGGRMDLSFLGNYMNDFGRTLNGVTYQGAGATSGYFSAGFPKLRATLAATYSEGPWSFTTQTRLIGAGVIDNGTEGQSAIPAFALIGPAFNTSNGGEIGPGTIGSLEVPFTAYLDLRGSYDWNDNLQFYAAVDNALDTPPPFTNFTGTTNNTVYDALGRSVRVGVRFRQ